MAPRWLATVAQGGNPGEGPGWLKAYAIIALVATALLGTILTTGLAILQRGRPRKPPLGGAIVAAYAWSALLVVTASLVALFAESWLALCAVILVGGAGFLAVWHRLWRDY